MQDREGVPQLAGILAAEVVGAQLIFEQALGVGSQPQEHRMPRRLKTQHRGDHRGDRRKGRIHLHPLVELRFLAKRESRLLFGRLNLLDEQTGSALSENFEIPVAAAGFNNGEISFDNGLRRYEPVRNQTMRQVGCCQVHIQ